MSKPTRFDARCPNCKSVLIRAILIPTPNAEAVEKGHIDVYCGVCGEFVLDLWYTKIRDCDGEDLNKILREQLT